MNIICMNVCMGCIAVIWMFLCTGICACFPVIYIIYLCILYKNMTSITSMMHIVMEDNNNSIQKYMDIIYKQISRKQYQHEQQPYMQSHHYTTSRTSLSPYQLGYTCLLLYVLVCGATALGNNTFYIGTAAKYVPSTSAGNNRDVYAGNAGSNINNYAGFGYGNADTIIAIGYNSNNGKQINMDPSYINANDNNYVSPNANNNYNKNIDNNRNSNITDQTYQDISNKPQTYSSYSSSFAYPSVSTTSSIFSTSPLSTSSSSSPSSQSAFSLNYSTVREVPKSYQKSYQYAPQFVSGQSSYQPQPRVQPSSSKSQYIQQGQYSGSEQANPQTSSSSYSSPLGQAYQPFVQPSQSIIERWQPYQQMYIIPQKTRYVGQGYFQQPVPNQNVQQKQNQDQQSLINDFVTKMNVVDSTNLDFSQKIKVIVKMIENSPKQAPNSNYSTISSISRQSAPSTVMTPSSLSSSSLSSSSLSSSSLSSLSSLSSSSSSSLSSSSLSSSSLSSSSLSSSSLSSSSLSSSSLSPSTFTSSRSAQTIIQPSSSFGQYQTFSSSPSNKFSSSPSSGLSKSDIAMQLNSQVRRQIMQNVVGRQVVQVPQYYSNWAGSRNTGNLRSPNGLQNANISKIVYNVNIKVDQSQDIGSNGIKNNIDGNMGNFLNGVVANTSTNTNNNVSPIQPKTNIPPTPQVPPLSPTSNLIQYQIPVQQPIPARYRTTQLTSLSYVAYLQKYKPTQYMTREQMTYNQQIFRKNIQQIIQHNNGNANSMYRMGVNAFTDIDQEMFLQMYVNLDINDAYKVQTLSSQLGLSENARQINNRQPQIQVDWSCYGGRVRNQLTKCGASYILPVLQTVQITFRSKGQTDLDLSAQEALSCKAKGCLGFFDKMYSYFSLVGVGQTKYYPSSATCNTGIIRNNQYQASKTFIKNTAFVGYENCNQMLYHLGRQVLTVGILARKLQFYQSGTFTIDFMAERNMQLRYNEQASGYHGVSLVGWDQQKGYLIKNYWGRTWGMRGYAYVDQSTGVCKFGVYPLFSSDLGRPCNRKFQF